MGNTVFVIGAGASVEFGEAMPVGSGLAHRIRELLAAELNNHRRGGGTPVIDALAHQGFHSQHEAAMRRVRDGIATKESIDDFIEEWKDVPFLADVAKVAIAHCILVAESETKLAELAPVRSNAGLPYEPRMTTAPDRAGVLAALRETWLGCVLRYHNPQASRRSFLEALQGTAFVVFNYDRCIEQYLWHHLTTALAEPPDEAREILRGVPVLHAFGSVGQLPELGGQHPFGAHEPVRVLNAATQIRTYTESVDGIVGERIASVVQAADRLIFLGSAFHQQNLDLLFPGGPKAPLDVWGTSYRLRPRKLNELQAYLGRAGGYSLRLEDKTAGQFLEAARDDLF